MILINFFLNNLKFKENKTLPVMIVPLQEIKVNNNFALFFCLEQMQHFRHTLPNLASKLVTICVLASGKT
jgi:hypothetical protein